MKLHMRYLIILNVEVKKIDENTPNLIKQDNNYNNCVTVFKTYLLRPIDIVILIYFIAVENTFTYCFCANTPKYSTIMTYD